MTRPVTLDVVLHGAGANAISKEPTIGFDATAAISRSAFGVSTFVPTVADTVTLRISAEFHPVK